MNTLMSRRLLALGTALVAGAALAVGGGAASASAAATDSENVSRSSVSASALELRSSKRDDRWIRLVDFDSRRACARAGERGDKYNLWSKYRCVRDWDRDWDKRDWDRRGSDWNHGRRDWDKRDRGRSADYTLYVKKSWR